MDERLKFIAWLLEGEKMAGLCRKFGISRVSGYKIYNRYKECGLDGLYDRSRRLYRQTDLSPLSAGWGAPVLPERREVDLGCHLKKGRSYVDILFRRSALCLESRNSN